MTCRRLRGSVLVTSDRVSDEAVCVRAIDVKISNAGIDDGYPTSCLRQIAQNDNLNHPNVVTDKTVSTNGSKILFEQKFCKWDLREYIRVNKVAYVSKTKQSVQSPHEALPLATLKTIIRQILSGLAHCHGQRVMHRNLKPENILVEADSDGEPNACISDFSHSRTILPGPKGKLTPEDPKDRDRSGREVRRLYYRAPELMFRPKLYSFEVDMWAVGCLLAEMALGEALFKQSSELMLLLEIFKVTGSPDQDLIARYVANADQRQDGPSQMINFPKWTKVPFADLCLGADSTEMNKDKFLQAQKSINSQHRQASVLPIQQVGEVIGEQGIDLLSKLLEIDPELRISASDALKHPFLADPNTDRAQITSSSPFLDLKRHQASYHLASCKPMASQTQVQINERMRMMLVDWMLDIGSHFRLSGRTLHLATNYLDKYLSRCANLQKNEFQLLGVSCLKLADIYNERSREFYRLEISREYAHMTSGACTIDQVVVMEREVAKAIDYTIDSCTAQEMVYEFLHPKDKALAFISEYLADLSLLSSDMTCVYCPITVAKAAIVLGSIELQSLPSKAVTVNETIVSCAVKLQKMQLLAGQYREQGRSAQTAVSRKWKQILKRHIVEGSLEPEEVQKITSITLSHVFTPSEIYAFLEVNSDDAGQNNSFVHQGEQQD